MNTEIAFDESLSRDDAGTPEPSTAAAVSNAAQPADALAPADEAPARDDQDDGAADSDTTNYVPFIFRDGLDLPIVGLEVFITLPAGQVCSATTGSDGAVTVELPPSPTGQASVEVKDHRGQKQQVCSMDLAVCQGASAIVVNSPKVKVDLPLRPLQQSVPAAASAKTPSSAPISNPAAGKTEPARVDLGSPWWQAVGAVQKAWQRLTDSVHLPPEPPPVLAYNPVLLRTLSHAGQPVTVAVGPECPNPQALKLGRNNVYREAIVQAAKRLGLIPQAICALIDCEAAMLKQVIQLQDAKGQPLKNKKGKLLTKTLREVWNPNSGNAESGAAGLTQFLASTWLDHVLRPGFYIHDQCVANGWVRRENVPKKGLQWMFVLSDGKTTATPYAHRGDATVKKCLAMRMDATWSINAAADYGNANLKLLKGEGFKLDGLQDMDKAKLMYLMHHEGGTAGPAFIRNTLGQLKGGTDALRKKFEGQFDKKGAKAEVDELVRQQNGEVEVAYRQWLAEYVDNKFSLSTRFFCSAVPTIASLSEIMNEVGGKKLHVSI